MATARKHWFKVGDSLLREPWPRDVKLTMVLLAAWLNQRWARDGLTRAEACRAVMSQGALAEVTGRTHRKHALNSLRTLAKFVSLSIRVRGEFIHIHWPKFAEFQNLPSDDGAKPGKRKPRDMPPPPTPPQTQTEEQEPSALGAHAPPWARLRNLRKRAKASEVAWERFLRDNFAAMEAWRNEHADEGLELPDWPSVALRFWNRRNRKPWEPESGAEIRARALKIIERDQAAEKERSHAH
jgi:hypothetical protein